MIASNGSISYGGLLIAECPTFAFDRHQFPSPIGGEIKPYPAIFKRFKLLF